jgi:hypothetical protein
MYFNVSFYAEIPFSHLTTKMENEKYFNLLLYTFASILRLAHFRWWEFIFSAETL